MPRRSHRNDLLRPPSPKVRESHDPLHIAALSMRNEDRVAGVRLPGGLRSPYRQWRLTFLAQRQVGRPAPPAPRSAGRVHQDPRGGRTPGSRDNAARRGSASRKSGTHRPSSAVGCGPVTLGPAPDGAGARLLDGKRPNSSAGAPLAGSSGRTPGSLSLCHRYATGIQPCC